MRKASIKTYTDDYSTKYLAITPQNYQDHQKEEKSEELSWSRGTQRDDNYK
jgi:hypothetical protein